MTLRQAIKLLAEDGIVESTRGKGHFVIPQTNAQHASSMDQFKHPLDQILLARVSMSSINYRVDLESEYTNHLFEPSFCRHCNGTLLSKKGQSF